MAVSDLEDTKRLQEIERADRAKALLENPMLQAAFNDLEREILSAMEQTHDAETVKKLHVWFVQNRKLQNILRTHVETGRMAALQLEQKRSLVERLKRWGS